VPLGVLGLQRRIYVSVRDIDAWLRSPADQRERNPPGGGLPSRDAEFMSDRAGHELLEGLAPFGGSHLGGLHELIWHIHGGAHIYILAYNHGPSESLAVPGRDREEF